MDEIAIKLLITLNRDNSRLIIHDLRRFDNPKFTHQMSPPSRRLLLDITIPLSVWQSIVLWLVLHIFEFVADVHLDELVASVQRESSPPEIELVLFGWSVAPN